MGFSHRRVYSYGKGDSHAAFRYARAHQTWFVPGIVFPGVPVPRLRLGQTMGKGEAGFSLHAIPFRENRPGGGISGQIGADDHRRRPARGRPRGRLRMRAMSAPKISIKRKTKMFNMKWKYPAAVMATM